MELTQAIFRLVAVTIIAVVLSILAKLTISWTGIDIKDTRKRNNPGVLSIAGIFNLLFILAVSALLQFWDHESLSKLGFSLPPADLIFILLSLLFSFGLALGYIWYLDRKGRIGISRNKHIFPFKTNQSVKMLFGFVILFIAALQEEIMFRGYFSFVLLPQGFFCALIISSLVFTLWHFLTNKVNLFQAVDWLLGGIMLFCIYWLSGSVWVATMVHFSRNFTNVTVFNISHTNALILYDKPISPGRKTWYTLIYSTLMLLFGFCYYYN